MGRSDRDGALHAALIVAWLTSCGNGVRLEGDADPPVVPEADGRTDTVAEADGVDVEATADGPFDDAEDDTEPLDADALDADASEDEATEAEGGCTEAPGTPLPISPLNGSYSGSMRGPEWTNALRPLFLWRRPADDPCPEGTFDIQIDDSCPVAGFATCDFPSPEDETIDLPLSEFRPADPLPVSTEPPVGRRYFWRVRACNAAGCSAWSTVRYLDVGRIHDDANGDGFADLAVGNPMGQPGDGCEDLERSFGVVEVFYGSSTGLSPDDKSCVGDAGGPPDGSNRLGQNVAWAGDLDADGYSDLLVNAFPGYMDTDSDLYHVLVYHGSAAGVAGGPDLRLDNPALAADSGPFGARFAWIGDINNDGFADIAVTAHNQPPSGGDLGDGSVFLYHGGPTGLDVVPDQRLDSPEGLGDPDVDLYFGRGVTGAVDVDGDGLTDLVIGAPGGPAPLGSVYIYLGTPEGLADAPGMRVDNPDDDSSRYAGCGFGNDTLVTNFSDLRRPDLVVAAMHADHGAELEGNVFLFDGASIGLDAPPFVRLDNPDNQTTTPDGYGFGASLATGDLGRDGLADLVVGAPYQSFDTDGEGNVFVFYGGSAGLSETPDLRLDNPDAHEDGRFGWAVSVVADADGDGYPELAVGAKQNSVVEAHCGVVYLYEGGPAGLPDSPDIRLEPENVRERWGYGFGDALH